MSSNDWCRTLGIEVPTLEAVACHREANTYALLLVALLERGAPMTLAAVAERFERADLAPAPRALLSLQRCKPARPPVYREGDLYHLDPHDEELDLWAFRLDLRPPKQPAAVPVRAAPAPLPSPGTPLTDAELDEAWTGAGLASWSAQRVVLAVLDAAGEPRLPDDVVAAVARRTSSHSLRVPQEQFGRARSAILLDERGRWAIAPDAAATLASARGAVRELVALARRHASRWPDAAKIAASRAAFEEKRLAHRAELARLSRAIVVAFPPRAPEAATLIDVGAREMSSYVGAELDLLRARLASYDVLAAVDVRALLRALGVDPGTRRLAELGPAQKSMQLNRRGKTLKITTALLVQGSCGLANPLGDPEKLAAYLADGDRTKLVRRLEADAKSLYALHEYGRLHGTVRLRWGFLDEAIPAPWSHPDEEHLYDLEEEALATGTALEVVVGAAPGWAEPWSRARRVRVVRGEGGYRRWLVDDQETVVPEEDVQRARRVGERA